MLRSFAFTFFRAGKIIPGCAIKVEVFLVIHMPQTQSGQVLEELISSRLMLTSIVVPTTFSA
jgi:hypothetical protein